ncbi:hypothetical protein Q1695_001529 [Nippostrongylus brasiliensis]|nr:hypothetical protein Q1695_001529 [Nippostrongylus brasiliensis]
MLILGIAVSFLATTSASPALNIDARIKDHVLPFALIADQDAASRDGDSWFSPLAIGFLALNSDWASAFIHFMVVQNYTSKLNYDGRGMELSDLKFFNGRLVTVDDKTGILYWIDGTKLIPWVILSDGDGTAPTPFKGEWLTEKDGFLYCGGHGRESTTAIGEFVNDNPMYVKQISKDGVVRHQNWAHNYITLRAAIHIRFPGYVIHEAVQWSDVHKRWFFLPRHLSKLAYNKDTVDDTGANVLLSANENFTDVQAVNIGREISIRGFSAFQFVQGSKDTVILAVKSEEHQSKPFASFLMVFTIDGRIILDETRIPGANKYEGVEFLHEEKLRSFLS